MSDSKYIVTASPHFKTAITTEVIMRDVILALIPAAAAGVYFFGLRALLVILVSVFSAIAAEALGQKLRGVPVTVKDGSAAVAGLLFALILPSTIPLWMPFVGAFFMILIAKQLFGGLGHNPFNPAHIGRAFLTASWAAAMTTVWAKPVDWSEGMKAGFDAVTTATPLSLMKLEGVKTPLWDLFIGNVSGSIGETSAFALLIGAAYLLLRGHITWHIPISFIGSTLVITALYGQDPMFHLLAGGLIIGAFFMATDYVTNPVTYKGQIIFGCGCGILTAFIRLFGGYPEGVCYAILIMNAVTPVIDKFVKPKRFGEVRRNA